MMQTIVALLTLTAQTIAWADDSTAYVNLAKTTGPPQHLAAGFIYGTPDNYPNQIPDHWYTDMGFISTRSGGAQLGAPSRGWIWGFDEYRGRINSTLLNYYTAIHNGGDFIILPHDIWGTDHANASTVWPGDNGDWTNYDQFVQSLMADLVKYNATYNMNWDIWNEPDLPGVFWNRTQQQWIELYTRTTKMLRSDSAFDNVLISGPSLAGQPLANNTWWTNWFEQTVGNGTIPDQYSYHLEGGINDVASDPQYTNISLAGLIDTYNAPQRQVNINEYATLPEQTPSGYAWWISRLERYGFIGLLGNWQSGLVLHDLFANLLTKYDNATDYYATDYAPAAGYPVFKYYNQNMTGMRANTTGSRDRKFDAYATVGDDTVKILAGSRVYNGTFQVVVQGLDSVGYCNNSGTINVMTYAFYGTNNPFDIATPVDDRGKKGYTYTDGIVTIDIEQESNHTAWAFEFAVRS